MRTKAFFILLGLMLSVMCAGQAMADDRLAAVTINGGLCQYGACSIETIISKDGRYAWIETYIPSNQTATGNGQLESKVLANLKKHIHSTHFKKIPERTSDGPCPSTENSIETVYSFYSPVGTEVISSCRYDITKQFPLFSTLDEVIAGIRRAGNQTLVH